MNHMTRGWIVYRHNGDRLELLGIYPTKEAAKTDAALLDGWQISAGPFLGWGEVDAGIFMRNSDFTPPPIAKLH
jgi:hypothetical protein